MLYQNNLLDITTPPKICFFIPEVISIHEDQEDQEINNEEINNETKFWKSFSRSIEKNKRGLDGKQRILSIIVEEFGPKILREKLQVCFNLFEILIKYNHYTY